MATEDDFMIKVTCAMDPTLLAIVDLAKTDKEFQKKAAKLVEAGNGCVTSGTMKTITVHPSDELLELYYQTMENK